MKCVVVYFTQTGNTEKIAKAIQNGITQSGNSCDIIKIQDAIKEMLKCNNAKAIKFGTGDKCL